MSTLMRHRVVRWRAKRDAEFFDHIRQKKVWVPEGELVGLRTVWGPLPPPPSHGDTIFEIQQTRAFELLYEEGWDESWPEGERTNYWRFPLKGEE